MERPLAAPLFSLIAGLSLAGLFNWYLPRSSLLYLLAATLATVLIRSRIPFLVCLSLFLLVSGNLLLEPAMHPVLPPDHIVRFQSEDPVVVEGVVDSRPEATERGSRLYLQALEVYRDRRRTRVSGRLLLTVGEGRVSVMTGDRVRFSSRIREPKNYGAPGEFDYERYLAFKDVFATVFVTSPAEMILIREGVEYRLQRAVDAMAGRIGTFIDASVPRDEGSILRALLIGDMGYVARSTKDAYSRTGVNHILSISGFHVGIIAVFIFQVLLCAAKTSEFLLLRLNLRRFILILTLPVIVFYLFLSGAAPATARSVIMIAVYIMALVIERETDPVHSLMLAAAVILALSPAALFDISFQLSFLALWGILVLTPLLMSPVAGRTGAVLTKLLLFFMASAAATAATLLTVAYYFHRVSATGLISNFFIVPLMGYGAVILGFSALPFIPVAPVVAKPLLLAAAFLVKISNTIILQLAKIPTLPMLNPTRLDLLLFYLFLLGLTFIGTRKGKLACCGVLALSLAGTAALSPRPETGKLDIVFLSVGQGESTLVTFPDGKRMLVDGGGNPREGAADVGERLLAPALWKLGVTRIDYLVLSHPHPDHMQGVRYVAANFPVGEYWEGAGPVASREHGELLRVLFERQVPVRKLDAASPPLIAGGARIEPLSPPPRHAPSPPDEDDDLNDESLVFRVVYGDFSALFTGDIGFAAEDRLLLHPGQLKCSVLKVPHHGSRYSSSRPFLRAAAPEIALISAGYRNSFHLPARETLDSMAGLGITVYRTDLDGTVRLTSDGHGPAPSVERMTGHLY